MSYDLIENLIEEVIGLNVSIVGRKFIHSKISQHMKTTGLTNATAYYNILNSSPDALDDLLEKVLIPETWFFRDRGSFDYLGEFIKTRWLPKHETMF